MFAPVFAALLANAAPSSPTLGPTDESALYEPPVEDSVIEPVEITPPPPVPEAPVPEAPVPGAPVPEPALDHAAVFVQPALPPPPPPPDGAGRLVGGSLAIGLGLAASAAVIGEVAGGDGDPRFVASTFIPLGLASIGVGTYLLVRGAKARANFNEWRAFTNAKSRPTGNGLLVGGTMSTVIGGVSLVAAAAQAREPDAFDSLLAPTLFAVGGAGVAVGVGALTWGLLRRSRYRTWRQSTFLSAAPTLTPLRGGVSFGVVGQF
ncbi:hypothetical protein ENSA5_18280 [Enhygromyxa salina]|uniref:Uncharacterized protein n=1 Tax=Enhygromyxa salina TaxID=215803 RepID=A0A2S9YD64_9BACT|nr:hypothetical protein [Enhygromyxa salina]PRQ03057.1 hypothetical protein ENSA5_18280 [Enhygromyxa salina]